MKILISFPTNLLESVISIVKPLSEPPVNIDFETFLIYSPGRLRKGVCSSPALGPESQLLFYRLPILFYL